MLRILFIGENWLGSNARSCAESLRRLGCDVLEIDEQVFIPQISSFGLRVARRLLRPSLVKDLNKHIIETYEHYNPDIVLAFKGASIYKKTLQFLNNKGARLYNYYPDTSAFAFGRLLEESLPEYDCVFYTKQFWYGDVTKRIKLKNAVLLPHGYDQKLHRPLEVSPQDISEFQCDVSLIAYCTPHKAKTLEALVSLRPDINLCVWGANWKGQKLSGALSRCVKGFPLLGESYVRAIRASRINLAIMSGLWEGASSGDLTTSRSYTIPASGGFMLHERNAEVLSLYREDSEIACFDSVEEAAEKIDYYLSHSEVRNRIAQAGHLRCVPAYSYDNRMGDLLRWHSEHFDRQSGG